jgi:integrase/recombinase XerD
MPSAVTLNSTERGISTALSSVRPMALPTQLASQIAWYLQVLAARPASPRTISNYRCHLRQLERFAAIRGCTCAEDLSVDLVLDAAVESMQRGQRALASDEPTRSKGNEASARLLVVATRGLLKELRKGRGLDVVDLAPITAPHVPERLQPRVDLRAFRKLEVALDRRAAYMRFPRFDLARDRALVQFLFETGLRAIEVSRLNLTDIDLERGVVLVREGKGRKPRALGIADPADLATGGETVCRLRAYLEERSRRPGRRSSRALWLGARGQRVSPGSLRSILRRLCEEAELPDNLPVHAFRRGWFTEAYQADPRALPILCARMGWSDRSQHMAAVYTRGALLDLASRPRPLITRALAGD